VNRSKRIKDRRIAAGLPRKRLLAMNSDDRLVELVIDGDDMAFELLYARHVADALAFADGLLGSRDEAEQAVRHSFAAAHAYLVDSGRKTAFEPWLYTILDNHCLSILQRRRGDAPAPAGEAATVVDLAEWRRKRKAMGALLPVAPSAGFHDSVMTACGIGGGAASMAAAPLLGGTLAKVAVVALLAGGAGVAADAVSDRGGPANVAQAPPAAVVDSMAPWSAGGILPKPRPDRRADQPQRRERSPGRGDGRTEQPSPQVESAPVPPAALIGVPPSEGATGAPAGAGAPALAQTPTVGNAPAAEPPVPASPRPERASEVLRRLGERVKEGLPSLEERVRAHLPNLGEPPPVVKVPKLPGDVELPKVDLLPGVVEPPDVKLPNVDVPPVLGDDGAVPPAQSSVAPPA
jgi:Sigma-70 region 2